MSMKTSNKIIIFDLDGTLIHSIPDMCVAMNKTLEHFKLKSISESNLSGAFTNKGAMDSLFGVFFASNSINLSSR